MWMPVVVMLFTQGCSSPPQVVVDPRSISSEAQYNKDMSECFSISEGYDLSNKKGKNTAVGAVAGGGVIAGVAVAVSGAVFWPAVPFIVAGAAVGGISGDELASSKEVGGREKIISDCLTDRGYRAYNPN